MDEQASILLYVSGLIKEETRFLNLQSSERVAFVYNAVLKTDMFKEITSVPKVMKSNEASAQFRMVGNDLFVRRKRYAEALEMYNKSIAHAENDSLFLALAYGNRSAVLFERKYYKECLEDIERALSNSYPDNLKEKLLVRKTKAEQLKSQQKQVYYIPLPEITNKNPCIAAATNLVEIQSNEKYGRHVVAKKRIKVGDIISLENSYTHMIHPESQFLHCHECLELCYNLIPCRNCTVAFYCSETCLKQSFNSYHKYECDFVPVMRSPQMLFIRIALKGLEDNQNKEDDVADEVYLSDRFKEIINLATNEDKRCFMFLCVPTIMASLAYHCLQNNAEFILKYANEIVDTQLQTFLYRAAMINFFNPFNIKKYKHTFTNITQKRVGTAIYAFTSLYNHSCVPNCEFFHHGTMLATRAIANIKKGEQCTLCYGMSYSNVHISQRKLALKKNYLFNCDCKACEENWPLFKFLPLGKQLSLSFEEKTMLNTFDENDANKKLLDELLTEAIRLVDKLEKYEPCQNLLKVQNMITEIYTYSACKDLEF